ncbi:hypothetical protein BU24DRAFT_463318 [Aaosphaeria arxii CBS 175.79]|uniref:Uncharacterized protein n=1 Tax=Aaosphaeria arxii CBS 175.79 TaxID=1450172 RepID=A0A6A5XNW7_9PLEO|nr:uncharacterized protein BU24DRAFT_463318 [Aaosphaeria arxii CBS 175.79]KAF2014537.1 hypothetical protein BU24DRAFT_463318 [Aaosphaeria arxii CBS 175.79]
MSHLRRFSMPSISGYQGATNSTGINSPNWRIHACGVGRSVEPPTRTGVINGSSENIELAVATYQPTTIISISEERNNPATSPMIPGFLSHIENHLDTAVMQSRVLPYLETVVLKMETLADMHYLIIILDTLGAVKSRKSVFKISFPGFFWFSGILHNRKENPMLAFATTLPNLKEMAITFHTAGLTASKYTERDRLLMEDDGYLEMSKQLRVLHLSELINRYGLQDLFRCRSLEAVHLECIESDIVAYHVGEDDPTRPFYELVQYIRTVFKDRFDQNVAVTTRFI